MEIERKFLIPILPDNLSQYESKRIEQGYISTSPVIRIRQYGNDYILTIKGKGLIAREEFELFLDKEQYMELSKKVEGIIIKKIRYKIPYNGYTIELDIFEGAHDGLTVAEVEFENLEEANSFIAPTWFGRDVSKEGIYQNSYLSKHPYA